MSTSATAEARRQAVTEADEDSREAGNDALQEPHDAVKQNGERLPDTGEDGGEARTYAPHKWFQRAGIGNVSKDGTYNRHS